MKTKFLILSLLFISVIQLNSQVNKNIRIPLLGDEAPSFTAKSTIGDINFPNDFAGKWKIIFSHPKDFTPVCSSELLELAQQQDDYKKLGVQFIVLSTDILSQHHDWIKALEEITYKDRNPKKIKFPLVDDSNYLISNQYGLVHPSANIAENIRAVFIIDPYNKIRSINFYPIEIGRNMDEIKRTVIALQTLDAHKNHFSPANWNPGDDLIVPFLTESDEKNIGNPDSDIYQISWFMNFRRMRGL